jgi:hypothetical protein
MDDKDIGVLTTTTVPNYHDGLREKLNGTASEDNSRPSAALSKTGFEVHLCPLHYTQRSLSNIYASATSTRLPSSTLASPSRADGRVLG